MVELIAVPLAVGGEMIGCTRSEMFELARTGELPTYREGRRRKVLVRHLREHAERVAAEQAGQGMSDMGAAGREALAAKREREREAALAAEAKPARRKGERR